MPEVWARQCAVGKHLPLLATERNGNSRDNGTIRGAILVDWYAGLCEGVTMADYLEGFDLSYWQGSVDWDIAANKVNFAYLRAGYGNDSFDTRRLEYMRGCEDHSIPYGLYWYVKPGKDWRKHADNFIRAIIDGESSLPPVVDVEETGGLGKIELEGWLKKLVDRVEAGITDCQLAIYTSPGFWNSNLPMTNWAKNRKLWVAHWTQAAAPTLPREWTEINQPRTWTFWQYGVLNNGAEYGVSSAKIDMNRYHGGVQEFTAEFDVAPHIPDGTLPPPPPQAEYPRDITLVGNYNLRRTPEIANNLISTLTAGTKLTVEGEDGEWYKVQAYIHKDSDG